MQYAGITSAEGDLIQTAITICICCYFIDIRGYFVNKVYYFVNT